MFLRTATMQSLKLSAWCFVLFFGVFFLTGESFLFSASLGIEDTFINRFKSFNELKRYAKLTSDHELLSKIKVCATA